MAKKRCPSCGARSFYATAYVIQDWLFDENGTYVRTEESCVEVYHYPDDNDIWSCANCFYEAPGFEFNAEGEEE